VIASDRMSEARQLITLEGYCDRPPPPTRRRLETVVPDQRHQALPLMNWVLLVCFIALQVADVVTTNQALAVPGTWEVNPLMELAQSRLGPSWWIPKLTAAGLAGLAILHIRRPWPIACGVFYYVLIVGGNLSCL
jgi:Domain of unknown function (DUF5658)